jgi:DNA-binding FrmR family transcriptional regulator
MQAVERAVCQAKRALIQDHIDHCLDGIAGSRGALAEFKEISKYL